jgi:MFS family permease
VFREMPRAFWIVWSAELINRLGGFVFPLLALYLTGRGLPVETVGMIVALWGVGSLASGPAGGFLTDHFGRRRTLVVSQVLGAAAMLHLGFARTPAHIAVAALCLGFFGRLYAPAEQAAIADIVPSDRRAHAYGLMYWAGNIGFAIGSALGGWLSEKSWWWLFGGDAATTLIQAVVVWRALPETRPERAPHEKRPPPWAPLADRPFVAFVALVTLVWLIFHQAFVTLPVDLREHGFSPAQYGALIAINGVLIALFQPGVASALSRFPRHRVLAAAALLTGVGFALNATVHTVAGYAAVIAVWTMGEISMAGIAPAAVADASPPALRGAYQGLLQMGGGAAALIAPVAGSLLMGRLGAPALWAACGGVGLVAAAGHLALGTLRSHEERAVAGP